MEPLKPLCGVKGMLVAPTAGRKGAMCGSMVVGTHECGAAPGTCRHQQVQQPTPDPQTALPLDQPRVVVSIAKLKESYRDRIRAMVDKIPRQVALGSINVTRDWRFDNERARTVANGGKQRMSRHALKAMAEKLEAWHRPEDPA